MANQIDQQNLNDTSHGFLDSYLQFDAYFPGDFSKETKMGVYQASLNYLMQKEANETNIAMQRENNALQVAENEKAYKRSTIAAQIKQFMDAGFSQQQAMQAVLGSAAGQYTPAEVSAATVGAASVSGLPEAAAAGRANDIAAFQSKMDLAQGVIGGISQIAQTGIDLVNAFTNPTGGGIGLLAANKGINTIMPYVNDLPPEARCISGLMSFSRQEGCPPELAKYVNSAAFKKILNFAPAQRAMDNFLGESFKFATGVEQFSSVRYNNRILAVNAYIKETTKDYEVRKSEAQSIIADMDAKYQQAITPQKLINAQDLLAMEFEDIKIRKAAYDNADYRKNKLKSLLMNESCAALVASMTQTKLASADKLMQRPEMASLLAGLEMFDNCGMSGDMASVCALILSNPDLNLSEFHKEALELIKSLMSGATSVTRGANGALGWFSSLFGQ